MSGTFNYGKSGESLIHMDYSQIEARVLAYFLSSKEEDMLTEEGKKKKLAEIDEQIAMLTGALNQAKQSVKALTKEPVFEDTLQGKIVIEQQVLIADIQTRLKDFAEVTGIVVPVTFGKVKPVAKAEPAGMPELISCLQREALQQAFDYCYTQGDWSSRNEFAAWANNKLATWKKGGELY